MSVCINARLGRLLIPLCAILALILTTAPAPAQTGDIGVHDPVIIKEGDTYTLFHTGRGISIKKSKDMVHWENAGSVWERDQIPAWTFEQVPGFRGHIWAPDISHFNSRYHLYYSISTFKSGHSAIGVATNQTLNPDSPNYKWEDLGPAIISTDASNYNAIDANIIEDHEGRFWLNWGSFWTGMKLTEIDPATAKPVSDPPYIIPISAQGPNHGPEGPFDENAIEAPFIVRHGDYYYQFVSLDLCCRREESNYKLAVGRSRLITGPYIDRDGVPMLQGGATLLMAGYGDTVHALGHNAVYSEDGRDYILHHMYNRQHRYASELQIRPLKWDELGWPVIGGAITETSVKGGAPEAAAITGPWTVWNDFESSQTLNLAGDGTGALGDVSLKWELNGERLIMNPGAGEPFMVFAGVAGDWLSGRRADGTLFYAERPGSSD